MKCVGFEVRGVLAGAYRGRIEDRSTLLHYYVDGAARTFCRRIREENLCDVDEPGDATCPSCVERMAKLRDGASAAPDAAEESAGFAWNILDSARRALEMAGAPVPLDLQTALVALARRGAS